jgi:hypothetical protein
MVATHLSEGANPLSVKKWENRLQGASAVTKQMSMEQTNFIFFTRWMVPESQEMWFVDVLEWRAGSSGRGSQVYIKTGKRASLESLGKMIKDQKPNKTWSKRFFNFDLCEAISFIAEDGTKVPMEIVARIQRSASGVEARESLKTFDKDWIVPLVQG